MRSVGRWEASGGKGRWRSVRETEAQKDVKRYSSSTPSDSRAPELRMSPHFVGRELGGRTTGLGGWGSGGVGGQPRGWDWSWDRSREELDGWMLPPGGNTRAARARSDPRSGLRILAPTLGTTPAPSTNDIGLASDRRANPQNLSGCGETGVASPTSTPSPLPGPESVCLLAPPGVVGPGEEGAYRRWEGPCVPLCDSVTPGEPDVEQRPGARRACGTASCCPLPAVVGKWHRRKG